MECPKCGAVQANGLEECSSCGIIFARWQPRAPRMPTLERRVAQPESAAEQSKTPWAWIAVGATFFVIFGLMWTKHYRSLATNPDDVINNINNQGVAAREKLARTRAAALRAQGGLQLTPAVPRGGNSAAYPADLNESAVREMMGNCRFFQEDKMVEIPRQYPEERSAEMALRYPALAIAKRQGLIEIGPPTMPEDMVKVSILPAAYSSIEVMDRGGDTIQLGLGRRRIDSLWLGTQKIQNELSVGFTWSYEQTAGAAFGTEPTHSGLATFHRDSTGWNLTKAQLDSRTGGLIVCP